MRRLLKKILAPFSTPKAPESAGQLKELRERLEAALPGSPEAARLLNRAADLELAEGNRDQALRDYGRCIDAHIELRQFDAASAICRKLLRLLPEVVRARCTLAWISIGKGLLDPAREYVDEYAGADRAAATEEFAIQQVRLMARCVGDSGFRLHLAGRLRELGDDDGAGAIEREPVSETLPAPGELGWDPVVFAALLTPRELNEAREKGLEFDASRVPKDDELPTYGLPDRES